MENPLVSIIIPAYNAAEYIEETINSCLSQTYDNIEIILQDDRSTDGTWELVNQLYGDNTKVRLCRNDTNLGIGDNWNAAYDKVNGEYVIIFNADDLLNRNLVLSFLNRFDSDPSLDIITGKFEILISETGETYLYPDHVEEKGGMVTSLWDKLYFRGSYHWNYTLIKNSLLQKVKLDNGKLFLKTQACDAELWYRCSLVNPKVYFDNTAIWGYYRKHDSNNSYIPNGELKSFLKDFLYYHRKSIRKRAGFDYVVKLTRGFITYCNLFKRWKSFEISLCLLYFKRIVQGIF
ncbi:glycosyltransferase family 2 protein [Mucilaginibacter sp.]|uniref:glycosyltransferase family 2 protein n=1 Tax=Mucilaginibacter sp. TaxID=1882438 RepID=UPI003B00508A